MDGWVGVGGGGGGREEEEDGRMAVGHAVAAARGDPPAAPVKRAAAIKECSNLSDEGFRMEESAEIRTTKPGQRLE